MDASDAIDNAEIQYDSGDSGGGNIGIANGTSFSVTQAASGTYNNEVRKAEQLRMVNALCSYAERCDYAEAASVMSDA